MTIDVQVSKNSGNRTIFALSFMLVLGIVGLVWYVVSFQHSLVETTALESAKLYSQAVG